MFLENSSPHFLNPSKSYASNLAAPSVGLTNGPPAFAAVDPLPTPPSPSFPPQATSMALTNKLLSNVTNNEFFLIWCSGFTCDLSLGAV